MVYADVPEHEGFEKKGAREAYEAEQAERPTSTDEWLERISDQLQVFVDAIDAAQAEEDGADSGRPTEDWVKSDIEAYAEKAGIDLTGHKGSKADMVAHIHQTLDAPPAPEDEDAGTQAEVTGQ